MARAAAQSRATRPADSLPTSQTDTPRGRVDQGGLRSLEHHAFPPSGFAREPGHVGPPVTDPLLLVRPAARRAASVERGVLMSVLATVPRLLLGGARAPSRSQIRCPASDLASYGAPCRARVPYIFAPRARLGQPSAAMIGRITAFFSVRSRHRRRSHAGHSRSCTARC